jgi:TctA family transporter
MTHDPSLARDAMAVMVACEHVVDNEMQQFLTLFSCIIWDHTVKSFIQSLHNVGASKIFESGAVACIRLITVPRWGASG